MQPIRLTATVLLLLQFGASQDGRPNIILILADDMGYSDLGSYGAEIIQTPNLDSLAHQGMRFTDFYNSARCWITRVSLLSGRYHHRAGGGSINRESMCVAEVLKTAGYNTVAVGKWHVGTPHPVDRGFDSYFGLIGGCASYFHPELWCNGGKGRIKHDNQVWNVPDQGFYMTDEFTHRAVGYLEQYAPQEKPFFMYLAYTAPHWPLHALPEDIEMYRGTFGERGWDELRAARFENLQTLGLLDESLELPARDGRVSSWENADDKTERDLEMAVYAAQIHRMDQGIGKVMDKLKELNEWENTLIMFLSDNGAASEPAAAWNNDRVQSGETGTRDSYRSYVRGWAHVSDIPFRGYKGNVYEGGTRTPLIAHWPAGIPSNVITNEPGHLVDIMPSILELAGAKYPDRYENQDKKPMDGRSLVSVFRYGVRADPNYLYWDHGGNAIRQGNWKAYRSGNGSWQLYDLSVDPFERDNVAGLNQDLVGELGSLWRTWKDSNEPTAQDVVTAVYGCVDTTADNYNPQAEEDDGSCTYTSVDEVAPSGPFHFSLSRKALSIREPGYHQVRVMGTGGEIIMHKKGTGTAVYSLEEIKAAGAYILQVTTRVSSWSGLVYVD